MNKKKTILILGVLLAGCGPTTHPMVIRPTPEQQEHINAAWTNMLTPHDRLDRTLLLDVLVTHQMHQLGVDQLELTSYKHTDNGLVVMRIRYDREYPEGDEFEFIYEDDTGVDLCHYVYSREEVEERVEFLFGVQTAIAFDDVVDEPEWEGDEMELEAGETEWEIDDATSEEIMSERQARMEEIMAATQPVDGD